MKALDPRAVRGLRQVYGAKQVLLLISDGAGHFEIMSDGASDAAARKVGELVEWLGDELAVGDAPSLTTKRRAR